MTHPPSHYISRVLPIVVEREPTLSWAQVYRRACSLWAIRRGFWRRMKQDQREFWTGRRG